MNSITVRSIDALVPFDRNARTHSEAQVAQLAASIKEFGFTNPVLIDETNTIIAGEGRVRAAKKLGMTEIPCIVLSGLTAEQKAAYVIADNKLALISEWDPIKLNEEMARLAEFEMDVNLTGFNEVEVMLLSKKAAKGLEALSAEVGVGPVAAPSSKMDTQPEEDEAPAPKDWNGMPEYVQKDERPFRTLLVHFDTQDAVDDFAALIGQNITSKTKYVSFPKPVKIKEPERVYV